MNPASRPPVVASRLAVLSGAEIGSGYVRQLLRAVNAGVLQTDRIEVVDRDPACAASRIESRLVSLSVADWGTWLDARVDALEADAQLVPYHWAPHLLLEWLQRRAERLGARVRRFAVGEPGDVPFVRPTRGGDLALSYATWPCPPTCIEPALCPHTRGAKSWSLAGGLATPGLLPDRRDAVLVFSSFHLVWGVASIPLSQIRDAGRRVGEGLKRGPRRYLVATASHCHGLAAGLEVAPAPA